MKVQKVFIVGCPRSGTTLLQSYLASDKRVISFTESHFFSKGFKKGLWGYLAITEQVKSQLKNFLIENSYTQYLNALDELEKHQTPIDQSKFFLNLISNIAEEKQCSVCLEKTPDHLFRISLIERSDPNVKFMHIVRSPLDTISSLYKASRQWGKPRSMYAFALKWYVTLLITKYYSKYSNHYVIFYNDLINTTKEELEKTFKNLDLNFSESILEEYKNEAKKLISSGESWKKNNQSKLIKTQRNIENILPKILENFLNKQYYKFYYKMKSKK